MARCLTVLDSTEAVRSPAGAENTSGPGRSMKEIDVAKRSCAVGYTQCAQCGNLFTHPVRKHHPRTYCSRSCRAKANMTAERARTMLAVRGLVEAGQGTDMADQFDDDDDPTDEVAKDSALRASPGGIQLLNHIKEVGTFSAADISNFLDPMNWYVHAMAATTATPLTYLDPTGNIPSGEAQRQADSPLVTKVGTFEREFGATWRDLLGFGMTKVLGLPCTPTVHWAPAQVLNDLVGWQTVKAKTEAGVPVRVALMEAGYTEAVVTSWGFTEAHPNGRPEPAPTPGPTPEDPDDVDEDVAA